MAQQFKRIITAGLLSTACLLTMAQQAVKGTVRDSSGEPLIGVSVLVNGKPTAVTDFDGHFTIPSASPSAKIEFSYVGYQSQTITIGKKTQLDITLQDDTHALNEVVVVGYGTLRKSDLTGSVGSIGTEKLNEKGAPSILESLQGSVPGVSITKTDGRAGSSMNIEIRGKNSISGSQSPLYVVDGVICSDIDFLNPQDIERIDILKDASSTAIYGSRATAGVVMVTTKSGANVAKRAQKPTISYDGYYGVSKVARMPDFMDAEAYYNYRNMAFLSFVNGDENGGQPLYQNGDLMRTYLQVDSKDPEQGYRVKQFLADGRTYNWRDLVLQDGQQQNHYVAVTGGSDAVHYHMGLGYQQEEGIYKGDEQNKFTIKGSLDAQINKYVSAGFSVNLARQNHDYASDTGVQYAFTMNPFMQAYDADGNINRQPGTYGALGTDFAAFTSAYSPLLYMQDQSSNRLGWNALGNIYLQVTPMKGLTFKTTFSPTFSYSRYGYYQGTEVGETENNASRTSSQGFSWTWDNVLTWDHSFADIHHLNLMGLVSSAYSNGESENLYYKSVMEGTYWWALGTSDQGYDYSRSSTGYSETSLMSYALRANYTLLGRYMFTGTVRWDGSSKFASDNHWGSFPSAAVAWRLSEEQFMKKNLPWVSNMKLRLSYGVTGNNNVGAYATQLTVGGQAFYPFGSTYYQGMRPNGLVDKSLKWEKAHEVNIGLDFGFLDERIRGSIDWYNKKSTDLLYSVKLPLETGGTSLTTNVGSVRNKGIEVSLTTENIATKDWHWTTSFNFAHNHNEVLEINGTGNLYNGDSPTGNLLIGEPYNNIYSYEFGGIVSTHDMKVPDHEIARLNGFTPGQTVKEYEYYNKCYGWVEGSPIIVDSDGNGKFDDEDKRIYRSDPAWTGSFTSNLSWKNWDFSFSIYTKQDYTVYSNFYSQYMSTHSSHRGRMKLNLDFYVPAGTMIDCDGELADGTFVNPRYQETTHEGKYPFPAMSVVEKADMVSYYLGVTNSFVDASYVKVKHITLGYTLPRQWMQKIGCSQLRLYATVTNPFVFTDYKGYDPEWASASLSGDGPSTVTWQFGANIKF